MNASSPPKQIAAIVLAAGASRRMGQPKLLLPWGETTVIGQVTGTLQACAELAEIVVVTGSWQAEIEAALQEQTNQPGKPGLRMVHNGLHFEGEMLSSVQCGLAALPEACEATLIALGDNPQLEPEVVSEILAAYRQSGAALLIPSYQMRRGHPWLVGRALWGAIRALTARNTLRDFLAEHSRLIQYVNVGTPSILQDLDTPEDYHRQRPA